MALDFKNYFKIMRGNNLSPISDEVPRIINYNEVDNYNSCHNLMHQKIKNTRNLNEKETLESI